MSREPSPCLQRNQDQWGQEPDPGQNRSKAADPRSGLTRVPSNLLPGLLGEDVQQQRGDERRQGPEAHRAVSAAGRHGEGPALMTRQTFTNTTQDPSPSSPHLKPPLMCLAWLCLTVNVGSVVVDSVQTGPVSGVPHSDGVIPGSYRTNQLSAHEYEVQTKERF